jgi:TPP-dependent indolepyruvate ferredoxin oxidoreductase alpha subunit
VYQIPSDIFRSYDYARVLGTTKGERKVLRIFRIFPFDDEQSLEGCAYLTKVVVLEDIKPCEIEKNIYISLVNIQTARKTFG